MPRIRPGRPRRAVALLPSALLLALLLAPGPAVAADLAPLPRPDRSDSPRAGAPVAAATNPAAAPIDPGPPASETIDPGEADLFARPRLAEEVRRAAERIQAGDTAGAGRLLDGLVAAHPGLGELRIDRAALAMLEGDPDLALENLEAAARAGFGGVAALAADPLFAPLAADPRFAALAAAPPPAAAAPVPAPITDGVAPVSGANTAWNPASERLEPRFAFPAKASGAVVPNRGTAATDILREHVKRGRAAGNLGDLYDNRDRGHSALDPKDHPQLARVVYSDAARAADLDYGLNDWLLFPAVTLGNSSTAITGGATWRSLPRLALTAPDGTGPMRLWQNAAANQLYVYPAHKDYGPEIGDLFPANTPYLLVSHGSSGSDKPFLEAVAMILAAYRPDTKDQLRAEGLIVPMTQMVFRRSLQTVRSRDDYFSAAAHPAAFEGYDINLARMISLANSIKPGDIPPQVRIRVTREDLGTEGIDYFGEGLSEQLFDTPAAVARVWRSKAYRREISLSAEETRDPNGRPLSFQWRLLQGDPAHVRITPSADGRAATVSLDWHEPFAISKDNPVKSARVDIGVFANNGVHDSAPAILSVYFPPEEARSYAPGPDGAPRIASIDYAARPGVYADPMLIPRADWRDEYRYAADGALLGWTRVRGDRREDYTAEGARLLAPATAATPARTEPVAYPLARRADGGLAIEEISAFAPR